MNFRDPDNIQASVEEGLQKFIHMHVEQTIQPDILSYLINTF